MLATRLPKKGVIPPQPQWKASEKPEPKRNEYWKDLYFKKIRMQTKATEPLAGQSFMHKKAAETAAKRQNEAHWLSV